MQQHEWSSTCDRVIMSLQRCSSYTGFRSLKGSILYHVCWFTRHLLCMHHSTLQTLSGQWLNCHPEPHCGQHSGDLYVPRTYRRFGDRAFAVAAPRVWNSLPTDIKVHRSTTPSFKRRLKTVLFNRGFAEYI